MSYYELNTIINSIMANRVSIIKSLSRKKNIIVRRAYHSRWLLCIGDFGLDDFFILQIGKLGSDLIEG